MFDYIRGEVTHKNNGAKSVYVSLETGGIGYLIETTLKDFARIETGSKLKIYTVLIHREDSMSLCGFLHREERDIFNILTSVSGVGAKMALLLLNEFEASELISFVIKGDFKELTRAKGVGTKLAQKIILELKDKLMNMQNNIPVSVSETIELKDENSYASNALANFYTRIGNFEKAQEIYNNNISKNPQNPDVYISRAQFYYSQKNEY